MLYYIYIIPIDVDDIPFYAHVRTMTPKDGKTWNCPSPCQAIPGTRIKHSAIHKTFWGLYIIKYKPIDI